MNRNVLSRRGIAGVALAAVAAIALAACNSNSPQTGESNGPQLTGDVKVDGSSTVAPLSEAAATLFKDDQPKVNVSVGTSGTGGGFKKFCSGETDISDASRPISETEKKLCADKGIKYTELIVANDALSVVVNKENTWASCLTVAHLKKMWDQGSTVKNWKEVDPSFPDAPLKLYGPGTDSGTFDYFTGAINGKEKQSRSDYTASEDDNVLVTGVAGDKNALGYFGFTYYEENKDKMKVVKIDSGDGKCVEPSIAAAQDGTYKPLARPLFIYVNDASLAKPQVKAFIDYYVSEIDEIVKEAQYVPLTAAQKATLKTSVDGIK